MRTVDQKLLEWAHKSVNDAIGNSDCKRKEFKTAVKGAPAFVQGCGLAQAVAFWRAKKGEMGRMLTYLEGAPELTNLAERARTKGLEEYAFLTLRTQHALVFLKRMVDAHIEGEEEARDS
ncbi:MAG: type III-B CRISPR module-associated protein Cmr5 [Fimbriimonadaceae bacterium]|nr:type III-B CRISPR module-associated protein Cmr5 [Fimbriimonadaceae bacterium]